MSAPIDSITFVCLKNLRLYTVTVMTIVNLEDIVQF